MNGNIGFDAGSYTIETITELLDATADAVKKLRRLHILHAVNDDGCRARSRFRGIDEHRLAFAPEPSPGIIPC